MRVYSFSFAFVVFVPMFTHGLFGWQNIPAIESPIDIPGLPSIDIPNPSSISLSNLSSISLKSLEEAGKAWIDSQVKCSCQETTCGCCSIRTIGMISTNSCLNATIPDKGISLDVSASVNGAVVYEVTLSVPDPLPICYKNVCLRVYNLSIASDTFHGCAKVESTVGPNDPSVELGCVNIPFGEVKKSTKELISRIAESINK